MVESVFQHFQKYAPCVMSKCSPGSQNGIFFQNTLNINL